MVSNFNDDADNKFKFQILDNQGSTFTDAWINVGTIDFNITTNKAKFTIKDSLFIDTTDVLTTLNGKHRQVHYHLMLY